MKIVSAQEMARIEKLAYAQGASEEHFMEQAGLAVAEAVRRYISRHHLKPHVMLLCGQGNNGGDGYVAGRILREGGFEVSALAFASRETSSPLCQLQSLRFAQMGGAITYVQEGDEISFEGASLLVDGLLGTGFHGELKGLLKGAIEQANASHLPVLAIDIPSGIDGTSGRRASSVIRATETLFLGLPKTGCFAEENWSDVGRVRVGDFGLGQPYIDAATPDYHLIDEELIKAYLPHIERTRHKYQAGYVVGLGGSPDMPGAPILSCFAALRAGAGIVRLLHPAGMEGALAFAPPEVIRQGYHLDDAEAVLSEMKRASAVFVGPGMGASDAALSILQAVLPRVGTPCVIDADALTLLAAHPIALPEHTIMTPHHGEMKRLLHAPKEISFAELLAQSRAYAKEHQLTLVLKGAPTYIFHHDQTPFICSRGDPGMATAGSGDVLTGIIAAFLAQTHDSLHAALLGVQFHALAGEHAAHTLSSSSMVASDITDALPFVFKHL